MSIDGDAGDGLVLSARRDAVAWITLNRPARLNAFAGTMRDDLARAVSDAGADPSVRVVVITGSGRGFCAGADVDAMEELLLNRDEERFQGFVEAGMRAVRAIRSAPMPVIAAVNGVAAGAGASLAAACDLRFAADHASLGFTFNRIGLHPDWGATHFLPRLLGSGRAAELLFSARMVDAAEALSIGLVDRIFPAGSFADAVGAAAADLSRKAPLALSLAKASLARTDDAALEDAMRREAAAQLLCFRSRDVREGIAAFRERRPAVFTGA